LESVSFEDMQGLAFWQEGSRRNGQALRRR